MGNITITTPAPRENYNLEASAGTIPGTDSFIIQARSEQVQAGAEETVWDQGGIYTPLASAVTLYVSSSSAADVGIPFLAEGLDVSFNEQATLGITNGQNQVVIGSGLSWRAFNRAINLSLAAGDIYIAEADTLADGVPTTPSKIKALIRKENQNTLMGVFTVPAGKNLFANSWSASIGKGKDMFFSFFGTPPGGIPPLRGLPDEIYEKEVLSPTEYLTIVPEKTLIDLRAKPTETSAVSANIFGILQDN